jgi:FKBP-type peptidyl-prolyl cis-trans isomerase (trigger factor)
MSAKLIRADQGEAIFLLEIDAETFERALLDEYNKDATEEYKKSAPAILSPEALLREYPWLEKITSMALEKLMPSYYMSAIKELGFQPMTFPKITPKSMAPGQPCVFEVRVTLEPKLELKQFEGLEATYTPVIVTEDDIARQLAALRKQHGAENDSKLLKKLHSNSIEALTEDIRSSLTNMAKEKTDFNRKKAVVKQLLAINPISLAEEIIEQQVMIEINQIRKQMGPQVMQNYMKSSGRSMDDLKKEVRPEAETKVKKNLLLSAIADKISPEVTEEDIKEAISKQPDSFMDFTADYEIRRKRIDALPGALDKIGFLIRLEKTTDYIVAKAIIHENKPTNITDSLPEYMK